MSVYTVEVVPSSPYSIEVENSTLQTPINLEIQKDNDYVVEISTNNTFLTFGMTSGYPIAATSGDLEYTRVSGLDTYIQSFIPEFSSIKAYNAGPAIQKGQAVYINGFNTNLNIPSASLYISNGSISEQKFAGLMSEYLASGNQGKITNFGILNGLNTTGTTSNISVGDESWSIGDILYAHPTDHGKLTKNKPDNSIVLVGVITNSHATSGSILVRSFISPKLSQLNDIKFDNVSNSDLIMFDSSESKWSNSNHIDGGIV